MLAIVLVIDVGDAGRHSDGGVLSNSLFGKALETNPLSLPSPKPLPGFSSSSVSYVIVGDEGFPLKPNLILVDTFLNLRLFITTD